MKKIGSLKVAQTMLVNPGDSITPKYVISDTIDENSYEDITSINNFFVVGEAIGYDYDRIRAILRTDYLPIFNTLTFGERQLLVQHYIYPTNITNEEWLTYYTNDQHKTHWIKLADITKRVRDRRWEVCRQVISFDLTKGESLDFYNSTKDYSLEWKDANIPKLLLWLANGTEPLLGIDYTNSGFAQKPYFSTTRRDTCLNILINGIY